MAQDVRRSHIFVVRTWTEDTGELRWDLRGMVRNIQSGETRYFRCWKELVAFVGAQAEAQERRDCNSE
jgi:hypothetical protein